MTVRELSGDVSLTKEEVHISLTHSLIHSFTSRSLLPNSSSPPLRNGILSLASQESVLTPSSSV